MGEVNILDSRNEIDNTLTDIERKVLQVMTIYNRPVTAREIADEMAISIATVKNVFRQLCEKGNIVSYSTSKGTSKFYTPTSSKTGLDSILSQKYVDIAGPLEKQFADIKAENEELRKQIDRMYANILTIMGIFVALFALIVINIEAIGMFASNITDSTDLFWSLLKLNIPIIVTIVVLILLIKFLLYIPKKR